MNGDAVVISRSIIQPEKEQGTRDHLPTLSSSSSTIIEHHGKQFLTELRERTERRYVQYYDEETHQMRFFEVIDSIPYRVIRPLNQNIQSRSQSVSVFPHQSKRRAILPSASIDQLNEQLPNRQSRLPYDLDHQRPSSQPFSPRSIHNNQVPSRTIYPRTSKGQLSRGISSNSISSRNTSMY